MTERFVRSLAALDLRIYAAPVGLVAAGVVQWNLHAIVILMATGWTARPPSFGCQKHRTVTLWERGCQWVHRAVGAAVRIRKPLLCPAELRGPTPRDPQAA